MKTKLLTLLIFLSGCTHRSDSGKSEPPSGVFVGARTDLSRAPGTDDQAIPEFLNLPPGLLLVKKTVRPDTPLREGPGSHFPIKPELLAWGRLVIETDQYKIWRKIITFPDLQSGWVHYQTLGRGSLPDETVRLPGTLLPLRHTRGPVTEVLGFPDEKPVSVKIPSGRGLVQLRTEGSRTLLWIPGANTIAWFLRQNLY